MSQNSPTIEQARLFAEYGYRCAVVGRSPQDVASVRWTAGGVDVVPVLVPAALAMTDPRMVGTATAFAINFLAFLSPQKVMVYNPAEFLGGAASILIGILLAIGVFKVVLPARPWETANRVAKAMREDLARLCLHERIPRRSAFEALAFEVARMYRENH